LMFNVFLPFILYGWIIRDFIGKWGDVLLFA
jgi:hypothetical protein